LGASFTPIAVCVAELDAAFALRSPVGRPLGAFARARVLAHVHGRPLGYVELDRPPETAGRDAADLIARTFRPQIEEHLAADGVGEEPACVAERTRLLARAPAATVVVATRERPRELARCLASLAGLAYPRFEVVVVDNAPLTNATRAVVERASLSARYVREDVPGLAAAHNRGLAEARGAVVAFTDDDVVVDRMWLAELAARFCADDRVACVTGLIAPAALDTREQLWQEEHWGFDKGFARREFTFGGGGALHPYAAGAFGSGASMAFRTDVLRRLGGFDPALGAGAPGYGGDDLAAFFDVLAAGHRLVYEPAAVAFHEHRGDAAALRAQAFGYGAGLAAYLTKVVVDRPARVGALARRAPAGVLHRLRTRSATRGSPLSELVRIERRGMLHGPFAYLRGRRRRRALYT
jgi:GT2 family glycosyltransferase